MDSSNFIFAPGQVLMVGCVSTGSRSATRGLKLEISRFCKYKSKWDVQEDRLQVAFVVYFEIFAQLCHPGFCGTTDCCNHAGTVLLQLRDAAAVSLVFRKPLAKRSPCLFSYRQTC